jgi:uncharacterized protein
MTMNRASWALSLLFALSLASPALAEKPDLPMPSHYVEDYAGVIKEQDKTALLGALQELQQKTGAQYIVLTISTTEGLPIRDFAIRLAEKWKLGQKDRQYDFEVGYGLEEYVTDAYCGQIGRNILVPFLKRGDYSAGILAANRDILARIAYGYNITLTGIPQLANVPDRQPAGSQIYVLIFIVVLIGLFVAVPLLGKGASPNHSSAYTRRSGYSAPGIFWGGGGFGGFGGGGGGSFGGGGASGGW